MDKNKVKQELFGECLAYILYGQEIHPTHVKDMIKESFKAGYEEAMEYQDEEINRLSEYNRKLCLRIGRSDY